MTDHEHSVSDTVAVGFLEVGIPDVGREFLLFGDTELGLAAFGSERGELFKVIGRQPASDSVAWFEPFHGDAIL
jgi:hypothetical protein